MIKEKLNTSDLPPQAAFSSASFSSNGLSSENTRLQNGHVDHSEMVNVGNAEIEISKDFSQIIVSAITPEGIHQENISVDPVRFESVIDQYDITATRTFDAFLKKSSGGQYVHARRVTHVVAGITDKPLVLMSNESREDVNTQEIIDAGIIDDQVCVLRLHSKSDGSEAYFVTGEYNVLLDEELNLITGFPFSKPPWGAGTNSIEQERPEQSHISSVPPDRKITKLH